MGYRITGPASIAGLATFTGAGEPNFSTASLDLQFARYRSLTDFVSKQNLVTFTRQSSGTYVGSDGLIKTAVTNLATYSEALNNAAWGLTGSGATITATTDIAAPNGSTTAWTLTSSGATAQIQFSTTGTSGASYTGSFYIRRRSGTGTVNIRVAENANVALTGVTSSWQRFSYTQASTTTTIRLGINLSGTADAVDIWGAQLEQSSTVGEYVKTTSTINSAPRFDHNPTTGESLGLLVEESRTNLLLQSEDFSTTWGSSNYTITTNTTTAPNGTLTADKLTRNTLDTTTSVTQNITVNASTAYNYSCFVKASEWNKVGLREGSSTGNYVTFDLSTGSIISSFVATGAITAYPNGWYRISMQMTTGGAQTTYGARVIPLPPSYTSGTPSYSFAGDGTSGIYLWGAQLEAGSFPTSYIPTTTAAVTRSADVASITGTNFSSWYRQDEGTVFIEVARSPAVSGRYPNIVNISSGASSNRVQVYCLDYALRYTHEIHTGGVSQVSFNQTQAFAANSFNKLAVGLKLNDTAFVANSSVINTDNSVTLPTVSQLELTGVDTRTIRRLTYWPTRLPNSTLQTITQ